VIALECLALVHVFGQLPGNESVRNVLMTFTNSYSLTWVLFD